MDSPRAPGNRALIVPPTRRVRDDSYFAGERYGSPRWCLSTLRDSTAPAVRMSPAPAPLTSPATAPGTSPATAPRTSPETPPATSHNLSGPGRVAPTSLAIRVAARMSLALFADARTSSPLPVIRAPSMRSPASSCSPSATTRDHRARSTAAAAAPTPMIPSVFSVPGRRPRSW